MTYEEWMAEFEERAAIREYDGGFDRRIAEELAWTDTVNRLGIRPRREYVSEKDGDKE